MKKMRNCGEVDEYTDQAGTVSFSYPSDIPYEKTDYIFASPDVEVISGDIPAIIASDHRPHVAELSFR